MGEIATPSRIDAQEVASMLGVPKRTIQSMAQRGEIPAAKVGRRWTFSRSRIQDWVMEKENKNLCRAHQESRTKQKRPKTAFFAEKFGGQKLLSAASATEKAYAQLMHGRLKDA
ncbi:helix-turn-helix domain-containing protein [Acetobacter tropicalis]|nr:helix-turn-helix domain-containing protein [Acetobacter tropicalis]MDE5062977.1 helix-turn-helix domain-containing protein [Wolbachia endosymbiont of Drosophila chauvacae]MDO8171924.1 helix-turn-helix domain-containing protein [Acetobacter tropicalis]